MYPHHAATIARLTARVQQDPATLALIIIGSVARGDARADSDVDCYLVLTDAAYQARAAVGDLLLVADDLCPYPNGHAGGRVVDVSYLQDVAARGPEPARFAFSGAILAFAGVPHLADLLVQIPCYPEAERTAKMQSFVSQLPVHLAYLQLAEYSQNPYLLAETAVELVLFGGRLILAHNRILYPNRKWFLRELARAPDRPPDLLERATTLLTRPSIATAAAFCACVEGFQTWPQPAEGALARFQHDRELLWRAGPAPLADR